MGVYVDLALLEALAASQLSFVDGTRRQTEKSGVVHFE
jgi:hypothetical protein